MPKSIKGLSREIIENISSRKNEPNWMKEFRLACFEEYIKQDLPKWGPDLSELNLSDIISYIYPKFPMSNNWDDVPSEIRKTFEDLGIPEAEKDKLAGVGAQYDSEVIYHNIKAAVAECGVVYLGIEEALKSKEYCKMVRTIL